jgi:hypothetical protein
MAARIARQKARSSSDSSSSKTNNAVPSGGPRVLSTLVSSASPGECGSMELACSVRASLQLWN